MSQLHDAIRFLADHVFADQSAASNAKRAQLEAILSPSEAAAVAESPSPASAPEVTVTTETTQPAPPYVAPGDVLPQDVPQS